ncbi:hypothetical protein COC69_15335 [Bacillus cereus]|uniref:Uncharacterized protein n=1 Tax=Bacillus cereus TaxID=1396 RepID=A0A9X7CMZ6_BACCE|nr:hypothetical protein COK42_21450 [Bacillus cereus]PGS78453.1 hypothetical protein COC69_15335 [Bacillus cereus]TKH61783.1 hypothetical protein FC680_10615 [Bacillus cereus]TKH97537.1 hypothetical protein FC693_13995 [Bacillus cereus]
MKSDKEFLGEKRGESKRLLKLNFWIPLFLFILLFVVVGFPVNDQLIHYFHVNTRLVNQSSYPNIRNDSSINAGMSSGCLLVTS